MGSRISRFLKKIKNSSFLLVEERSLRRKLSQERGSEGWEAENENWGGKWPRNLQCLSFSRQVKWGSEGVGGGRGIQNAKALEQVSARDGN